MNQTMTIKSGNKGLTIALNLFPLTPLEEFDSRAARLWIMGQVRNVDTNEVKKFNDAGQLISILGKWNAQKFQERRANLKKD